MSDVAILLLKTAMTLLLLVQGNPNIDPALRNQAITVANQAIDAANQQTTTWPTVPPTSQRPIITSVNGKGGFGTGDSNYILGKYFTTVQNVYLRGDSRENRTKTYLGYSLVSDTRLNVVVPDWIVKDAYDLYVQNHAGTSAPYDVGYIGTSIPNITVLSPNGGESYSKGSTIQYVWSQNYESEELEIHLSNFDTGKEYYHASINGGIGKNVDSIPSEGTNVPGGRYRITICDEGTPNPKATFKPLCDTSDSYFTIKDSDFSADLKVKDPDNTAHSWNWVNAFVDEPIAIVSGARVSLQWTVTEETATCFVSQNGKERWLSEGSDTVITAPITTDTTFTLECSNHERNDMDTDSVQVNIKG